MVMIYLQVKQKALMLAEMQAFLQKRQDEDEALRNEIDDLTSQFNKLVGIDSDLVFISMLHSRGYSARTTVNTFQRSRDVYSFGPTWGAKG